MGMPKPSWAREHVILRHTARRGETAARDISHLSDGQGSLTEIIDTVAAGSRLILPSEVDNSDGPVIVNERLLTKTGFRTEVAYRDLPMGSLKPFVYARKKACVVRKNW